MLLKYLILIVFTIIAEIPGQLSDKPPNIVFIFADDLGWNDIGFNNPDIQSPNIDKLAYEGVILNQSYVQPVCSPSRAALMTGVYPYRLGLQHLIILAEEPVCVPLNRTLLPEVLKEKGYSTHMIGKWHLGFCDWKCTPTDRGFDSFLGYYNGEEDYFTKVTGDGYDFRDNKTVSKYPDSPYSTFLYTERIRQVIRNHNTESPLFLYLAHQNVHEPLKIPQNYSHLYPNINDKYRRTFSTMVTILDDSIGDLITELKAKGIYNNTLIVFSSDNGGWTTYSGNNYPLRGGKLTIFEGGTRAAGFVHGPMFNKTGIRYDGLIHQVDWFPTLAEAAGADYDSSDQDGVSQWKSLLSLSTPSDRNEVLYNLDLTWDPLQGRAAIRIGDWKYVAGFPGLYFDWYKPAQVTEHTLLEEITGDDELAGYVLSRFTQNYTVGDMGKVYHDVAQRVFQTVDAEAPWFYYLFNLKDDPEERHNLYDERPDIVKKLSSRLDWHKSRYVEPNNPGSDSKADPSKWGGNWTPGWCPALKS